MAEIKNAVAQHTNYTRVPLWGGRATNSRIDEIAAQINGITYSSGSDDDVSYDEEVEGGEGRKPRRTRTDTLAGTSELINNLHRRDSSDTFIKVFEGGENLKLDRNNALLIQMKTPPLPEPRRRSSLAGKSHLINKLSTRVSSDRSIETFDDHEKVKLDIGTNSLQTLPKAPPSKVSERPPRSS